MATLQRVKHLYDGQTLELVHVMDTLTKGGEFTVCGLAIPDATLDAEEWERIGEGFEAPFRKCTCVQCKRIIAYYKKIK